MAQIQGGPAVPVSVVTGGKIKGGKAIPVYGYTSAPTDGRRAAAGPARPVYVVSDAQMAAGTFQLEGGPALPMYVAPSGLSVVGDAAQPVYVVGGSLGGAASATILISDGFSGTDGTSINGRTPDTVGSATWATLENDIVLSSNKASRTTAGAASASIESGKANVTITSDLVFSATGDASIMLRASDASNYWIAGINATTFFIYEKNAGSFTLRASASEARTAGTTYSMTVIASGTSIIATIATSSISYSSATFNQTTTKHGIRLNGNGSVATSDNFKITNP